MVTDRFDEVLIMRYKNSNKIKTTTMKKGLFVMVALIVMTASFAQNEKYVKVMEHRKCHVRF